MQKGDEHSYEKTDWFGIQKTQAYVGWCGYAFENICVKHVSQIKKAFQIGGVYTTVSSWYQPGNSTNSGAQIDLLLDRADQLLLHTEFWKMTININV